VNRLSPTNLAPILIWLVMSLVASSGSLPQGAEIALAVFATIVAITIARTGLLRFAILIAMIPTAFVDGPTWSFLPSAALLAIALMGTIETPVSTPLRQLQRHLYWCRRRGESAHLLWVHAPDVERRVAAEALDVFRVTDSVALIHDGDESDEIVAMVDHTNFERAGIERRLRAFIGDGAGLGWADYPEDGVTIETLFTRARELALENTTRTEPEAQAPGLFRRWNRAAQPGEPIRSTHQG
jgi:hypothetical protein